MSRTLELPDEVYAALQADARSSATTPAGWIASRLPAQSNGKEPIGVPASQALGIGAGVTPPPNDETAKQWLAEHRLEKYG